VRKTGDASPDTCWYSPRPCGACAGGVAGRGRASISGGLSRGSGGLITPPRNTGRRPTSDERAARRSAHTSAPPPSASQLRWPPEPVCACRSWSRDEGSSLMCTKLATGSRPARGDSRSNPSPNPNPGVMCTGSTRSGPERGGRGVWWDVHPLEFAGDSSADRS
jgi:hypothetical protein